MDAFKKDKLVCLQIKIVVSLLKAELEQSKMSSNSNNQKHVCGCFIHLRAHIFVTEIIFWQKWNRILKHRVQVMIYLDQVQRDFVIHQFEEKSSSLGLFSHKPQYCQITKRKYRRILYILLLISGRTQCLLVFATTAVFFIVLQWYQFWHGVVLQLIYSTIYSQIRSTILQIMTETERLCLNLSLQFFLNVQKINFISLKQKCCK